MARRINFIWTLFGVSVAEKAEEENGEVRWWHATFNEIKSVTRPAWIGATDWRTGPLRETFDYFPYLLNNKKKTNDKLENWIKKGWCNKFSAEERCDDGKWDGSSGQQEFCRSWRCRNGDRSLSCSAFELVSWQLEAARRMINETVERHTCERPQEDD